MLGDNWLCCAGMDCSGLCWVLLCCAGLLSVVLSGDMLGDPELCCAGLLGVVVGCDGLYWAVVW